mgnify:CR=1 FL=1
MEESTICKNELRTLREDLNRMWLENSELRETVAQHQQEASSTSSSLGPQVLGSLGQVKKTLVRKLGGDSSAVAATTGNSFQQDSIDSESSHKMGKNNVSFICCCLKYVRFQYVINEILCRYLAKVLQLI